ncbi:MAG: site-specific integrase [Clostridia bacterium]|nr:site-specific integrase [Clostridia bacterium]
MAKRRMNGEGTIYQRPNGLWVCEITLGYDANKKRIKKTVSSMDRDKLQKKINDLKYMNDRHLLTNPSEYTVSDWIEFWLDTYKKPSIKPTTYDMYRGNLERYIKPQLGHYKLDKLNPIIIQKFINDISEKGLNTQNGLSQSSVKKVFITLSQACKQAVSVNILYQNPCNSVQLPKKPAREATAFSVDEQNKFLSFCNGNSTFENLFIFAFNTGMRLGEMLALTWDDIDLENRMVNVNKNLVVINDYNKNATKKSKTVIDSTTKTTSGKRDIPLSDAAEMCVKQQQEKNINSPFVFCSAAGTPLTKRNIYRAFNDRLKKAKITTHLTIHSMRHSFATRLLEKGADIKTVSELLGHKSIQITLDIYSHISANLKHQTISLLN